MVGPPVGRRPGLDGGTVEEHGWPASSCASCFACHPKADLALSGVDRWVLEDWITVASASNTGIYLAARLHKPNGLYRH